MPTPDFISELFIDHHLKAYHNNAANVQREVASRKWKKKKENTITVHANFLRCHDLVPRYRFNYVIEIVEMWQRTTRHSYLSHIHELS